jgi:Porin PorA
VRGRRLGALVAAVLAVLLCGGAAVVHWLVAPALVKIPRAISIRTVAEGDAQVFVLTRQQVQRVHVVATRTVTGDRSVGTGRVAVYDELLCLRLATLAAVPADGCPPTTDPSFLQRTTDRIAFDRKTGLAVTDGQQFGAAVDGDASVRHLGLGYTFGIDTGKRAYPFFDTVAGRAFPMAYRGTSTIEGLLLYRFEQRVPPTAVQIQKLLPAVYGNLRTVWVEPTTGVIVKGSEQITERFAQGGQVVFDGTLSFTDETVHAQANFAKDQLFKVRLIRSWVPLGALAIAVALVIVAVLLLRRRPKLTHIDGGPREYRAAQR